MEWQAFEALEGLPQKRADYRSALVCHTLVQLLGKKSSGRKIEDFVLGFEVVPERPSLAAPAEADTSVLMAAIAQMNAQLGGVDLREKEGPS